MMKKCCDQGKVIYGMVRILDKMQMAPGVLKFSSLFLKFLNNFIAGVVDNIPVF